MFEKHITSPQEAVPFIIETDVSNVDDGDTLHLRNDDVSMLVNASVGYEAVYRFSKSLHGPNAVVPDTRVAFVTSYSGAYIPDDFSGRRVEVPVRNRPNDEQIDPLQEFTVSRFLLNTELHLAASENIPATRLAVARAVFEVVNGIGADASAAHFKEMEERAETSATHAEVASIREQLIEKEIDRMDPRTRVKSSSKNEEYWQLRNALRPIALKNLGFTEDESS